MGFALCHRKDASLRKNKKLLFHNFDWIGAYPLGIQCIWVSSGCIYIFINFTASSFPLSFKQPGSPPKAVTAGGFELEKAKIYD